MTHQPTEAPVTAKVNWLHALAHVAPEFFEGLTSKERLALAMVVELERELEATSPADAWELLAVLARLDPTSRKVLAAYLGAP